MLLHKLLKITTVTVLLALISVSCAITRRVPEKEFLLRSNKIIVDNKKINTDDLNGLIRQKPNRKILGFLRFHLRLYNMADFGTENAVKRWFKNTVGEPPVLLDTMMVNASVFQQKSYLNNKGYFNATVNKDVFYRKKKADVTYNILAGIPYTIRNISYNAEDDMVESFLQNDSANRVLRKESSYDVDVLYTERERITNMLKNNGYYNFSREFIFFEIDTAIGNYRADIKLTIKNPVVKTDDSLQTAQKVNHRRFIINKVYIFPQQNSLMQEMPQADTALVTITGKMKRDKASNYYFVYPSKPRLKPGVITRAVFMKEGRLFSMNDVEQSYKTLSGLKNFRFINIQFSENPDTLTHNPYMRALDCKIELTRMPSNYYNIAAEATNSGGNLGVAGNVSYQNRNMFRGAEIFDLKLNGALEVQKIFGDENADDVIGQLPFNTMETGVEARFEIPRFLLPVSPEKFSKYFRPRTYIKTGLNYQQRSDYTRYILNASFGYEWKENEFKKHIFTPVEISSIKINPDSSFIQIINAIQDKRIQLSYNDHLSMAMKYSFVLNNQKINKRLNFSYFRGNVESSGNALWLASKAFGMEQDELGIYKIFNIRYSQFVKFDADYRFYNFPGKHSSTVYRLAAGIAFPYGNIDIMPFDKSFYAGGANGIRAWKLYDLGPGAYSDTNVVKFYKTGDIHLEANVEYRFDIYKYLKGALFLDAGNIWLRKENIQFPNAEFKLKEFHKQIAMGGGIGARLDFSFFIIRIDAGIPLRDPSRVPELRWVYDEMKLTKVNFNLGIGYPF